MVGIYQKQRRNLDQAGLINNILLGTANIDKGRKYLTTDSLEHAGRLFYEDGIAIVLDAFKNAQVSGDPQTMVFAELVFLKQELQFCDETDIITRKSLTNAIQNFDDSLRSLKIVEDTALYQAAEATYLTDFKYRYHDLPRDAIHLACAAHRTRLQNSLRTPGINMIEKAVLTQRTANMSTIQEVYFLKQKKALIK